MENFEFASGNALLKKLNKALVERVKDIRLILNRKYNELEQTLEMTKESFEFDITQMRVQYGKDIAVLNQDHKQALKLQRKEMIAH
jgi:hypothetical protein